MRCMKSSAPKLYLDLRPYRQNTIHKHFSRVFTVASIVILIPLHRKRSKSYSPYLGRKMARYTQNNTFQIHRVTAYFALRTEDAIIQILRVGPRQIMMRQFITATFDHTDIISQRLINFIDVIKVGVFSVDLIICKLQGR
jgi:hypothetical protein